MKYTKKQKAWIDSRPKNIRKVISKLSPLYCYKDKNGNGHYQIYSYDEDKKGRVTLSVDRLDDSFLPFNYRVFGYNPKDLIYCGCLIKGG